MLPSPVAANRPATQSCHHDIVWHGPPQDGLHDFAASRHYFCALSEVTRSFVRGLYAPMKCTHLALVAGLVGGAARAAVPVDYARPDNWICRPGDEGSCTSGLDALTVTADGTRTLQVFASSPDPPIDCFYVYPTASEEPSTYSDLRLTPAIAEIARSQAGRLTSRCRLFAPIYRQLTEAGLDAVLSADGTPDWRGPYVDVLAAWQWYRAHANNGRGVVLIGHSQGAILLQRLLAEQIDGRPDQAVLLAAFLAGDPALPVAKTAGVGGLLKHIPVCTAGAQTGCVYVWGSYLAGDPVTGRVFGHNPAVPLVAACANPAAPGGGAGALKAYLQKPRFAPESDPPWADMEGQLSGQCAADAEGDVLRVTILPTRFARQLQATLQPEQPSWGLHNFDMELMQGNILDRVAQETAAWLRSHSATPK
jgi:hypothetical protein